MFSEIWILWQSLSRLHSREVLFSVCCLVRVISRGMQFLQEKKINIGFHLVVTLKNKINQEHFNERCFCLESYICPSTLYVFWTKSCPPKCFSWNHPFSFKMEKMLPNTFSWQLNILKLWNDLTSKMKISKIVIYPPFYIVLIDHKIQIKCLLKVSI